MWSLLGKRNEVNCSWFSLSWWITSINSKLVHAFHFPLEIRLFSAYSMLLVLVITSKTVKLLRLSASLCYLSLIIRSVDFSTSRFTYEVCFLKRRKEERCSTKTRLITKACNSRHMNKPTCTCWIWPKLGLWNPFDLHKRANLITRIKIWTMRFVRFSVQIYEIFFTSISVPLLFFALVVHCRSFLKE